MPCRAGRVCRQAPQCPWITDDVLQEAFHRFARVSNANRQKSEGRRYGSHVPGPLEAHRRASKRRMGVQAVASSMPPPGVDFGGLFGLGGFTSGPKIDDWKWQPPGVKEKPAPAHWSLAWAAKPKKEAWESFLEVPEEMSQEDLVDKSKQAFEELLAQKGTSMNSADIQDLVAFLRTSANESGARNTLRFAEWLVSNDADAHSSHALYKLVTEKTRLQTLGEEELPSILSLLLQRDNAAQQTSEIADLLDAVPSHAELTPICTSVTRSLVERVTQAVPSALHLWLRTLRAGQSLQGPHFDHPVWYGVYEILADCLQDFGALKEHLSTLRRQDLAQILLRHWVPQIMKHEHVPGQLIAGTVGHTRWLIPPADKPPSIDRLEEHFNHLQLKYRGRRQRARGFTSLAQLIAVLRHHRLPYTRSCHGIFDILMHCASPGAVYRVFCGITLFAHVGVDNELALKLVQYHVDKNHLSLAHNVFRILPTLPLSSCMELPIAMAEHRACSSKQIWSILQRLRHEDIVPREQRKPNEWRNPLTPEHVDLIHLVAIRFSQSAHMNPRSAFRRVWECYIFLRDRGAQMRPMLSRAFVTAGIIRPLKNLQRVSVVKARYILQIVGDIEGRDVADELDRLLWKAWNKDVLPRIRARNASRGIQRILGPMGAVQEEASRSKANLLVATRAFRRQRAWLSDEKMRNRAMTGILNPDLDVAGGAWPFTESIPPLDTVDKSAAYSPIGVEDPEPSPTTDGLLSSPNDEASEAYKSASLAPCHESDVFESSSLNRNLQAQPTSPPTIVRSGLGYGHVNTPDLKHRIECASVPEPRPMKEVSAVPSDTTGYTPMDGSSQVDEQHPVVSNLASSSSSPSQDQSVEPSTMEVLQGELPDHRALIRRHSALDPVAMKKFTLTRSDVVMVSPTMFSPRGIPLRDLDLPGPDSRGQYKPFEEPSEKQAGEKREASSKGDEASLSDRSRAPRATVRPDLDAQPSMSRSVPLDFLNKTSAIHSEKIEVPPRIPQQYGPSNNEAPIVPLDHFNVPTQLPETNVPLVINHARLSPRKIELQCWANTTSPPAQDSPPLPTPDFLRWYISADGRYRLLVEWGGTWMSMRTADDHVLRYKSGGQREKGIELRKRIRAALDSRAGFMERKPGEREGLSPMAEKGVVIRKTKSEGKGNVSMGWWPARKEGGK